MKFGLPMPMPVRRRRHVRRGRRPVRGPERRRRQPAHHRVAARARHAAWPPARSSHSYPHCWRCKKPVIFRATEQWFVSMERDRPARRALMQRDRRGRVDPRLGRQPHRRRWSRDRPDWCISRQRAWGVPIPVFACAKCGETVATDDDVRRGQRPLRDRGRRRLVHAARRPSTCPPAPRCPRCGGTRAASPRRTSSTCGSSRACSHTSVLEARPELHRPAELYLEGSDQHRGWFQSSLLTSVGAYGVRAVRARCSRTASSSTATAARCPSRSATSSRRSTSIEQVRRRHHPPVGRLGRLRPGRQRLRRDPRPHERGVPPHPQHVPLPALATSTTSTRPTRSPWADMPELDRFALVQLSDVARATSPGTTTSGASTWSTARVFDYCGDLSAFYLDVLKDRLYADAPDSLSRRSAQTVLARDPRRARARAGADPLVHLPRRSGSSCPRRCATPRACTSPTGPTLEVPAEDADALRDGLRGRCSRCARRSPRRSRRRATTRSIGKSQEAAVTRDALRPTIVAVLRGARRALRSPSCSSSRRSSSSRATRSAVEVTRRRRARSARVAGTTASSAPTRPPRGLRALRERCSRAG